MEVLDFFKISNNSSNVLIWVILSDTCSQNIHGIFTSLLKKIAGLSILFQLQNTKSKCKGLCMTLLFSFLSTLINSIVLIFKYPHLFHSTHLPYLTIWNTTHQIKLLNYPKNSKCFAIICTNSKWKPNKILSWDSFKNFQHIFIKAYWLYRIN